MNRDVRAPEVEPAGLVSEAISEVGMSHEGSEFGIVAASLGATVFTSESRIINPAELVARVDFALYESQGCRA